MKKEEKLKLLKQMREEYERTLFLLQVEERFLNRRWIETGKDIPELRKVRDNIKELKERIETIEDTEKDLEKGDWPEKEKK